jgi:hypothetical protein
MPPTTRPLSKHYTILGEKFIMGIAIISFVLSMVMVFFAYAFS